MVRDREYHIYDKEIILSMNSSNRNTSHSYGNLWKIQVNSFKTLAM
jgi:hypothetical protein